ncbi:MAG: ATP-binding protein [Bacteroidetes bacterium]|nr:ATP-binding protein [Bacteroidota bacterium]
MRAVEMKKIEETKLWLAMNAAPELQHELLSIRSNCEKIADRVQVVLPGYTDHSVRHMDALWGIAEVVFTDKELERFSASEVFVLGASFYFHDLGMARAATVQGCEDLRNSDAYRAQKSRAISVLGLAEREADFLALEVGARDTHAEFAEKLCKEEFPGLGQHVIEKAEIRRHWADYIAKVSVSHHWGMARVENELGKRQTENSTRGEAVNLSFLACALRIIDYAHINTERANYLERVLRTGVSGSSLLHWKAQENISPPIRVENRIKYTTFRPIEDQDAWWLFYEMATGLDVQISLVSEFLSSTVTTTNRFSLEGVSRVSTPTNFASFVQPFNFEPVDVRFKADSIESVARLIETVGGKTLYGDDDLVPLRELIQNARDAIVLESRQRRAGDLPHIDGKLIIGMLEESGARTLIVEDNGVGMTSSVIRNYLLGIATNFWESPEFYNAYPDIQRSEFRPAGKFGIGFLSIFMVGNKVSIATEKRGEKRFEIELHGLDKRGAMREVTPKGINGTRITVKIEKQSPETYSELGKRVSLRAPMLPFDVELRENDKVSILQKEWWKRISQKELYDFVLSSEHEIPRRRTSPRELRGVSDFDFTGESSKKYDDIPLAKRWLGDAPEYVSSDRRIIAIPGYGRVLLCSKGISIQTIRTRGVVGLVDMDDVKLTASRNQTIEWDYSAFNVSTFAELKGGIVRAIGALESEGMIPSRSEFLVTVISDYGPSVLYESTLPWFNAVLSPGESRLLTTEGAKQLLLDKSEVMLSYGVGPWSSVPGCRARFPGVAPNAVVIPVSRSGQPSLRGSYDDKNISGTLESHFHNEPYRSMQRAYLLNAYLEVIATAWGMSSKDFYNSVSIRQGSDEFYVHLSRR